MLKSARQPLPYMGDDLDRYDRRGTPFTRSRQGTDQTGTKHYRFNALGYRGAEFDAEAERHVFTFGESHAFGGGLNEEEAWPERLTRGWADLTGIERASVCLSNFAEGGCSNGYIARAVISQCEQLRPDLVAIEFASMTRSELLLAGRTVRSGVWLDRATNEMIAALPNEQVRELARDLVRRASAYERFATPLHHAVNTILNMMLVREYCAAADLRAIASVDCLDELRPIAAAHPPAAQLLSVLEDGCFLMPKSIRHFKTPADLAANEDHPGPRTHQRFADAMLEFLQHPQPGTDGRSATQRCETLLLGELAAGDRAARDGEVDLRRSGVSNEGIAQQFALALTSYRPERVEIRFADYRRSSGIDAQGQPFEVSAIGELPAGVRWALLGKRRRERARQQQLRAFREYANDGSLVLEALRWILLTQYLARSRGLRVIGRVPQWDRMSELASCESLAPLFAQLDPAFLPERCT